MTADISTADLFDLAPEEVQVCELPFRSYGKPPAFMGRCATLRTPPHHANVSKVLDLPGEGRVLVIDAGGNQSIGILGDRLATLACARGWAGVIIHGAVRDTRVLAGIDFGVRALGATARRSNEPVPEAETDVPLELGGVVVRPGDWIYADEDAVIVSPRNLITP